MGGEEMESLAQLIEQYEEQLTRVKARYAELEPLYGEYDKRVRALQQEWWELLDALHAMRRYLS